MMHTILHTWHDLIILLLVGFAFPKSAQNDLPLRLNPIPNQINAVRFDPSYYYDSPLEVDDMSEELAAKWNNFGVNTIYFKAYDPVYGAKFETSYDLNIMADYGIHNLLEHIIGACSEYNIKVFAWIPAFQHKQAWKKNPEWRVKLSDGIDYKPTADSYFLCPENPEVRDWWLGFLEDLLKSYDDLEGVDIAEPIISWNGNNCRCEYHEAVSKSDKQPIPSEGLTQTLTASVKLIHGFNKKACITTVASVHPDGQIFSVEEQSNLTGFDLNNVLDAIDKPDWVNVELMWQQWADEFDKAKVFTPEWTKNAAKTIINQIDGRATVIGHLELTSFGNHKVDAQKLSQSIYAAKAGGIEHIDIYDTHLIDSQNAWSRVEESFRYISTKNILICYEPNNLNDARQIESLLSHFKTEVQLQLLLPDTYFQQGYFRRFDVVFCFGTDSNFIFPSSFLKELAAYDGTICWVQFGIDQFLNNVNENRYGFHYKKTNTDSTFNSVIYNGYVLPKIEHTFEMLSVLDNSKCHLKAYVTNGKQTYPYALRSGNLWYFADLPTNFVIEGGRHIVISDLLHEIVREDHQVNKLALIRIEDVSPLNDVNMLEQVADYLNSEQVPFSISLIPFYINPESNTAASLSNRPEFVNAIHNMIESGGTVIMHGSTHQYKGETAVDHEFWDVSSNSPIISDSKEYVRRRIISGLAELQRNKIYPVAWETPHYSASQLDYSVINSFFSTSYERRQTIDKHSTDQLLPYYINNHSAGGKIIPENLGYIPLEQPDAMPMLQAAKNNLAIRDGVASFMFHPFVDHSTLKKLIPGLKNLGYKFTSSRQTSNWVKAPGYALVTGNGDVELKLNEQYFHEFYIDQDGDVVNEEFSDSILTGVINKKVVVPDDWIYIAEGISEKPDGFLASVVNTIISSIVDFSNSIFGEDKSLEDSAAKPLKPAILINKNVAGSMSNTQLNFMEALHSVGVDVQIINTSEFSKVPEEINLLIVPYVAAQELNDQQNLLIMQSIQDGMNLILEKNTNISQNIGIHLQERSVAVNEVVYEFYPKLRIVWDQPDSLQEFIALPNYVSYFYDINSKLPVVIGGEYGKGKYLYINSFFDPYTNGGYGRFPYFVDVLKRQFSLVPAIRRNAVEVYFDPDDKKNINAENLVKMWKENGVRKVYVSSKQLYTNYQYDYDRLIQLAHQNAILIYAWLDLPFICEKFWNDNKEWRLTTVSSVETEGTCREPSALNIQTCQETVFCELKNILTRYNWDGINLANLNYEVETYYQAPQGVMPWNDEIRLSFAKENNIDPGSLLDSNSELYFKNNPSLKASFNQYCQDQIVTLHHQVLDFLYQLNDEFNKDWEIIITTIDNAYSFENIDSNIFRLAKLADDHPFTLNIDDPNPMLLLSSERYNELLSGYFELRKKMPIILNVKILSGKDQNKFNFSKSQLSGIELYHSVESAVRENVRISIYSEANLHEVDFSMMPHVMAAGIWQDINGDTWSIEAPKMVNVLIDADSHEEVLLDGAIWAAYHQGRVLIPQGKHIVQSVPKIKTLMNNLQSSTRLVDLSGELINASIISRGIILEYTSTVRNLVILTNEPKEIFIDGNPIEIEIMKTELGFLISLSAGEHVAHIYTETRGNMVVRQSSILLSSFILVIGFLSVAILLIVYIKNTILRKYSAT